MRRSAYTDTYPFTPSDPLWPLCACGCGEKVPARGYTNLARGHFRGSPAEYLSGHNHRRHIENGMLRCPKCGESNPVDAFAKDSQNPLGRACWCRACNRAKVLKWSRTAKGKQRIRVYGATRRVRTAAQFVELVEPQMVYERDFGICGICGEFADRGAFHVDHIVPLSRGGDHSYENVQVSHPSCNSRKHNKLPEELHGSSAIVSRGRAQDPGAESRP